MNSRFLAWHNHLLQLVKILINHLCRLKMKNVHGFNLYNEQCKTRVFIGVAAFVIRGKTHE